MYQIRMDDLTADSNPDIRILWESSLPFKNWTVLGIDIDYSTTTGGSDYIYWALTNNQ